MSRVELGVIGFYLYSFIKSKCGYHGHYTRDLVNMSLDTGIGKTKLTELLKVLEESNMITNSHNVFVTNLPSGKAVPPNTYNTYDYFEFLKIGKKVIKRGQIMDYETYDEEYGIYVGEKSFDKQFELVLPSGL